MRFRDQVYISALLPLFIGAFVGVLSAIMGVGGFYFSPCNDICPWHANGSCCRDFTFPNYFVTANVTFLQSITTQTVDIVLAGLLMLGGVIGAQIGSNASSLLRGEQLRGLLALLVLAVCFKLFADLTYS